MFLQLWPDWTPSRARGLARFCALVKIGAGHSIDEPETIAIRMLDAGGEVVDVQTELFELSSGRLVGPAWQEVPGHLVRLADAVTQVEATLRDVVSERVTRADAMAAVLLKPVAFDLGLDGEPALWWSYRNQTRAPVDATEVLRSRVLWVDEHRLRPPQGGYNGPPYLAPAQALSGWWSLDDFGLIDRRAPRRFALEIRGDRSDEFTYTWQAMA
jgi:hypothetical protein